MEEHCNREKEMLPLKPDHNVRFYFAFEARSGLSLLGKDGFMVARLYFTIGMLIFFLIIVFPTWFIC